MIQVVQVVQVFQIVMVVRGVRLVRWSGGQKVRRSEGQVVRWSRCLDCQGGKTVYDGHWPGWSKWFRRFLWSLWSR